MAELEQDVFTRLMSALGVVAMKQDQLKSLNKYSYDVPGLMLVPQTAPEEIFPGRLGGLFG